MIRDTGVWFRIFGYNRLPTVCAEPTVTHQYIGMQIIFNCTTDCGIPIMMARGKSIVRVKSRSKGQGSSETMHFFFLNN